MSEPHLSHMSRVAGACVLARGCEALVCWEVVLEVSDGLQSDYSSLNALAELVELLKVRRAWRLVLLLRPADGLLLQLRSGLEPGEVGGAQVIGMVVQEDEGNEASNKGTGGVGEDAGDNAIDAVCSDACEVL